MNLVSPIFDIAQKRGPHPALEIWQDDSAPQVQTYAALVQDIQVAAHHLTRLGLMPGDRVMLRLADNPTFPKLFLACIQIGVVPIPTSVHLQPAELSRVVATLEPKYAFQDDGVPQALDLPQITSGSLFDQIQPLSWFHPAKPNDLAYIVLTSGTSGLPRAVAHAHRAIAARRAMWDGWMDLKPTDRLSHAGAFNWTYTLGTGLLDPWSCGATAVIPRHHGDWAALARILDRASASIFAAVPGVYRNILKHSLPPLPALRHGLSAGERLPDSVRAAWTEATGTDIFEAYGMSECSTFLSESPSRGPGLRPQHGRKVDLIEGEIAIGGDEAGLMLGYIDGDRITLPLKMGSFRTGDLAKRTDGVWTVTGRADDLMNAGGYRVHPSEVEAALLSAPGIKEAAVTAFSPKSDVTIVGAGVVPTDTYCETQMNDHLASCLAGYKHPKAVLTLPALPRTANGKIDRRKLRALLEGTP